MLLGSTHRLRVLPLQREGKRLARDDNESMDSIGARQLAARIAAGVRVGAVIELVRDSDGDLHAGDRGTVSDFSSDGHVVIRWENGGEGMIDPVATPFRPVSA